MLALIFLFVCAYSTWDWVAGDSDVGMFFHVMNVIGVFFWSYIYLEARKKVGSDGGNRNQAQ